MEKHHEVTTWLKNWFINRNNNIDISEDADYYSQGYIDSFGIIELINEIENFFNIYFSDDDFRREDFRTIKGLAQIIISKL